MLIAQEKLARKNFPTCAVNIEESCRIAVQLTGSNQCSTNTTDVSHHQFPSNAKTRAIWVKKVNRTEIPKYTFLCSNHFTEDCFDKSYEMYEKFLAKDGKKPSRKLVKGTIPMLFAHNTKVKSRS